MLTELVREITQLDHHRAPEAVDFKNIIKIYIGKNKDISYALMCKIAGNANAIVLPLPTQ